MLIPKRTTDLLTTEEMETFPFCFDIDIDYRTIDREAGFFEALGLKTTILTTGAGYALVLDLPEAG